MQKIRLGIELDHVIRDINRQVAKYYQKDFDESLDLDEVDYKDDVIHNVCHFKNEAEIRRFLYEEYPLEVFGHAGQVSRNLSRDLNMWMAELTNQEEADVEVFFYSMNEDNLTIQSSYFFLSKIGSRVRRVVFPKTLSELYDDGDVFITANGEVIDYMRLRNKPVVMIKMNFNKKHEPNSDVIYESFREFLDSDNKLKSIINLVDNRCQETTTKTKTKLRVWTWMQSLISFFHQMNKGL